MKSTITGGANSMAALDLRAYAPGDESAIGALFEASFGRPLPATFWEWRYRANPAGGPWIELAWDGDVLAAHYAVAAATLRVEGVDMSAALSMTTMTHPEYRGRGLFPVLAERLYGRLAAAGAGLVYGFPNTNSHRGFVRDLHWRDVREIPTLRATVAGARFAREPARAIAVGPAIDERFDRLWGRVRDVFPVWLRRDAGWLRWRFAACPIADYTLAAWEDEGEIRGWAALKPFAADGLDLVDLVAQDSAVAADLAAWALGWAERSGRTTVATWCPLGAPWRATLESCGFHPAAPVTYMGARAFAASGAAATEGGKWGVSMADSDVY